MYKYQFLQEVYLVKVIVAFFLCCVGHLLYSHFTLTGIFELLACRLSVYFLRLLVL